MIKRIYVDLDEVLTSFHDFYETSFGRHWADIADPDERWKPLNDDPTWYGRIPVKDDAQWLISYVRSLGVPVKVLSATGWDWVRVGVQKTEWAFKNFGFDPSDVLFVKEGKKKFVFAKKGSLLIDDMERNVIPWREAGGSGIVHYNAENTIGKIKEMLVA